MRSPLTLPSKNTLSPTRGRGEGEGEGRPGDSACWNQRYTFQPLIHSSSFEPAGFIAVLVETTSMGLMVTKS